MRKHRSLCFLSTENNNYFDKNSIDNLLNKIKIKQISCGNHHITVLDENNNIYSCGVNNNGQLGLGHYDSINYFEQVNDTNINNNVKLIAAGGYFTIIVTLQNKIYGAGYTLIQEPTNNFTELTILNDNNKNNNKNNNENYNNITNVKCGGGFTIFLNEKNELFGAGCNSHPKENQLFQKITLPNYYNKNYNEIIDIHCGDNFAAILTKQGEVFYSKMEYCPNFLENTFRKVKFKNFNYCKQIACLSDTIFYLSTDCKDDQLFDKCFRKINFEKNIEKIYSGFSNTLYLLTTENEIYKLNKNVKFTKVDIVKLNTAWEFPYLSVSVGLDFIVVLNSNYKIDEINDGDCIKMKRLLFNQLNNYLCDVVITL